MDKEVGDGIQRPDGCVILVEVVSYFYLKAVFQYYFLGLLVF